MGDDEDGRSALLLDEPPHQGLGPGQVEMVGSGSSSISSAARPAALWRGDALALAAGEEVAVVPDLGVVSASSAAYELVRTGSPRRALQLIVRDVGPAEGDVVADGAGEDQRVLLDHGHPAAQLSTSSSATGTASARTVPLAGA